MEIFAPTTNIWLDRARRTARIVLAPAIDAGAVVVLRTTVAAEDAPTGDCDSATKEVAARTAALMRDKERRTQNSCG